MKVISKTMLYTCLSVFLMLSMTSIALADLEAVKLACVSIQSVCGTGENGVVSSGSGFLVSADGFIVTNAHVVISNDIGVDVKVGERTHTVKGTLYYHDDLLDIAILKVQLAGLDYLELGADSSLKLGQRLFAVGSPLVFTDIFTDGIFSAYNEELQMIQHTAELSHGNSGGPLVTEGGVVMGVNTVVVAFPGESRYFFAIPSSIVQAVLNGVQSQANPVEVKVDCDDTLGTPEPAPPAPAPPTPTPTTPTPSTPEPAPTAPAVDITSSYMSQLIDDHPEGWMNYSSSYFLYSFDLPDFYDYQFTDTEAFEPDGLEFYSTYWNYDDPNYGAIPIVSLYIGFPGSESFHEFKKRLWDLFRYEGFTMYTDFEMENVQTSMPGLEVDAYWFDGDIDSDYSTLSRYVFFIRDGNTDMAYYCLDFTFNNLMGDAFDNITLPLIIQTLWTFGTDG